MNPKDLAAMPKIDAHVHLVGADTGRETALVNALESSTMRWLSICWLDSEESLAEQIKLATALCSRHPRRLSWATSFSLRGFGEKGWTEAAIADIDRGRKAGAVGVKVWKNIGMTLREKGRYVMIDDPRFDPVLDHVESTGMTLVAHIGEPRNCWLPIEKMTVEGDRSYYREHPQYHGENLPDMPGYEEQIGSCERMVERHPRLRVVGCHLASLEYDVTRLASTLDRYPNLAVDTSGRICHFQVQDRKTVRDFILKYQDRILYGTDEALITSGQDQETQVSRIMDVYATDERYFATEDVMEAPVVDKGYQCQGLGLDAGVLRKLYHDNAVSWYPGLV